MPSSVFYPYKNRREGLHPNIHVVDGEPSMFDGDSIRLYLMPSETWQINISETFTKTFRELFPKNERLNLPVNISVIFKSIPSLKTQTFECDLTPGGEGYNLELKLNKNEWQGTIEMFILVSRNKEIEFSFEYASSMSQIIASSKSYNIYLDQPPMPPGSTLEVVWIPFGEGKEEYDHYPNLMSYLDISGELPKIYLNENKDNLKEILDSKANRGVKAGIRDHLDAIIVAQHWSALLTIALDELKSVIQNEDNSTDNNVNQNYIDQLSGWKKDVLQDWSTHLFPGFDKNESMEKIAENLKDSIKYDRLIAGLGSKIQSRDRFKKIMKNIPSKLFNDWSQL